MGTRLLRIGYPVNECQFAGIVDRGQKLESGMQSGKSIAQRERVGVGEGGSVSARFRKQRFALHIPALRGIDWDGDVVADFGAVGVVAMGDDVVESVIGPAQKDEEQFLDATIGAGLSEPAFCERLLDEEWNVGQRAQGGRSCQAGGGAEEVSAGEDLGRVHGAGVGAIFSAGPHCS